MMCLPQEFIKTIKLVHKGKGEKWLKNFNDLITYCEKRWSINIEFPYELSFNFVAPAIKSDGDKVVIKLVVPGEKGLLTEIEALKQFDGNGIARLIDYDIQKGIMILEYVSPGEKLSTLSNDHEATVIISQVMKKLWKPAPNNSNIPTIFQRETDFKRIRQENEYGIGPISKEMLIKAEHAFSKLTESITELFLLHGDFHHYNVLSSNDNSWIAIDPKGLIGEREYDVIQFLLNKLPSNNVLEVTDRRIDILVNELGLVKERVLMWGYCHTILSVYWTINDFGVPDENIVKLITIFEVLYTHYTETK